MISVIVLSAFYSSLLVCYFAIVAVDTNSYMFNYFQKKELSITKVFIGSIASLNLVSLIIFSLLGFAIETLSKMDNFLIYYGVIAMSPFGIFFIFSIITKIKTNKHYWLNFILYAIFTVILLPIFITT